MVRKFCFMSAFLLKRQFKEEDGISSKWVDAWDIYSMNDRDRDPNQNRNLGHDYCWDKSGTYFKIKSVMGTEIESDRAVSWRATNTLVSCYKPFCRFLNLFFSYRVPKRNFSEGTAARLVLNETELDVQPQDNSFRNRRIPDSEIHKNQTLQEYSSFQIRNQLEETKMNQRSSSSEADLGQH
ncbi:hypothetical protein EVAR_87688_1 [Eumeta japonica]|uniref:Uncharacterized protein n=1 Tax=Eumeta variegata TaxID=151549 RepID=A0A4C1XIF1_EUMVA|nr:hypothetical protein EVAR_87688_1 [Eumeta japonica]